MEILAIISLIHNFFSPLADMTTGISDFSGGVLGMAEFFGMDTSELPETING